MSGWKRWAILGVVAGAVALTVVAKSGSEPSAEPSKTVETDVAAGPTVLLVADPREAESNCGCGEIIRSAREAALINGATYREVDPADGKDEMARLDVRVVPTVLIWTTEGSDPQRFEGESPDVIEGVQAAVAALRPTPEQP